jgi:hypothetical protein
MLFMGDFTNFGLMSAMGMFRQQHSRGITTARIHQGHQRAFVAEHGTPNPRAAVKCSHFRRDDARVAVFSLM